MKSNIDKELIEALGSIGLPELHYSLLRYDPDFNTEKEASEAYPEITMDLVNRVMEMSDECPVCFERFLSFGVNHSKSCKLMCLIREEICDKFKVPRHLLSRS